MWDNNQRINIRSNTSTPRKNAIQCTKYDFVTVWPALSKSHWELREILDFQGIRCRWGQRRIILCTKLANKYKTARKQNSKWWCLPTTVAAYHHYLTHPPLAETTIQWSWLVVVCLGAGWVPRRPWDDGGRHGWKVCLALILLVFCTYVYAGVIVVGAENRLIININD